MATDQLRRLQAAVVDGRAHNVYFRQTQLERLCNAILAEEAALRKAMVSDCNYTPAEAISVLHASTQTVKDAYASLQPIHALEMEHRVSHGIDAVDGESPYGLVYIEPEPHTLLFSICSPLSAAIAAGNCVVVLIEQNLQELSRLMRKVLTASLDADTFAIVSQSVRDDRILDESLNVRQAGKSLWPRINELTSLYHLAAITVVDRTANIPLAARELAQAGTGLGGRSPYSPSVVLVNEFVIRELTAAVMREYAGDASSTREHQLSMEGEFSGALEIKLRGGAMTRTGIGLSEALIRKTSEPTLFIEPVRSLDDAINSLSEQGLGPYLAAYHFCDLKSAKYLSQFVDAQVTFINQIPRQLLIGPAAPRGHGFDLRHRYPISLFSRRRPAFVQPPTGSSELAAALSSRESATADVLLRQAKEPLRVMKRSKGGGVGFFEQGFLLNASFILATVLTLSATGAWQLWSYRRARS